MIRAEVEKKNFLFSKSEMIYKKMTNANDPVNYCVRLKRI